ncbi:binding-protein-dependent transport systems inner membrane component [Candidatus Protofrankia californiensis]|uniref:Binding-protein-dependent transport systems inner membrane component n=1 Tax=Candidatus Protofrankia californiensis TaxID=1839754 RepID=A0A1C3NYH6_9ACTN|nr:binding-protein-dependent transport systems inner membrane component [Candidatus Protofrankia californiensis]
MHTSGQSAAPSDRPVSVGCGGRRSRAARFLLGRAGAGLGVLWGAATLAFITLHVIPGDPVDTMIGPNVGVSPGLREQINSLYGFDSPLVVQYSRWLARLCTGHLGRSYQLQQPVTEVLGGQLWPTAQLSLAATAVAVALAVTAATATAGRHGGRRTVVSGLELLAVSSPTFWVGILLATLFSSRLGWLPATGDNGVSALVLPALTLAVPIAGVLAQVLRDGLDGVLDTPFIVTVRARGVGETVVLLRHALRHASLPLVTLVGWVVGSLLGGTVITENVFARPGIGRITLQAISSKDVPVVTAVVLISALVFVIVNTAVDLLYLAVDPRLRTTGRTVRASRPTGGDDQPPASTASGATIHDATVTP